MAPISFARGVPGPDCLPVDDVRDAADAVLAAHGAEALSYAGPAGYGPLRELLAARHGVEPGRIVVTNGSLQAFVFLTTHLVRWRDTRVVVEGPTYDRSLSVLAGLRADVVPVAVDADGLDLDALERELSAGHPPLVYTIPTFQNPTGRTLSLERRRRLAEIARERGVLVFEDDPYGLVRFEGDPAPSVFELAEGEGVAYASSFSKSLAPGLRVGYVIVPPGLAGPLERLAASTYVSPGVFAQSVVAELVTRDALPRILQKVVARLRERRDAMLDALTRELASHATWTRPEGGYFLWLDFLHGLDAEAVRAHAEAAGVTFVGGRDFFPAERPGGEHAARLAFSSASPVEIRDGVGRLADAVDALVVLPTDVVNAADWR